MGIYVVRAFVQLKQMFDTLKELMPSSDFPQRPIGFITNEEKPEPGSK